MEVLVEEDRMTPAPEVFSTFLQGLMWFELYLHLAHEEFECYTGTNNENMVDTRPWNVIYPIHSLERQRFDISNGNRKRV